ncbi:hypothetical protein [Kribbella speibonae]|uniref:hypothetical protein n=1 Tax=Kribbella speibonae TaxID=1572660 RepID=UPI00192D3C86|nr:hypothetical protein [Kribbella speibonae]
MPHHLRGREIPPTTREYQWVASIVEAVERRTGRPSSWNRRLYEELTGTGGTAQIDGPMTINRQLVLEPVMRAYDATGALGLEDTGGARIAVMLVVHETDHHQHEVGEEDAPDAVRFDSMEAEVVTEGLADSNRDRIVDQIITDIAMDKAIPRIHDVQAVMPYAGYQAGVEGVLNGLHTISGRSRAEVHAAVDGTPFVQRYNAMADVVIDSRLANLMPPEHRSQIRLRLSQPLRAELGSLGNYSAENEPPVELAARGRETAARAVQQLERELGAIEQHYRQYGEHPPRMPMSSQERAQVQRIETYYGRPSIDLETSHLRQFLDTGAQAGLAGGGAAAGAGAAAGGGAAASAAAAAAPADFAAWRTATPRSTDGQAR